MVWHFLQKVPKPHVADHKQGLFLQIEPHEAQEVNMAALKMTGFDGSKEKTPSSGDFLELSSNMVPDTDDSRDIGTLDKALSNIYSHNINGQNLNIQGNTTGQFVATVDNDNANNGHALKVTSDGNGAGTHILDVETGSTTVFRVRGDGRVGVGNPLPNPLSHALTINGDTRTNGLLDVDGDTIRIRNAKTPTSSSATGQQGEICYDSNYLYICVGTDSWKRITLESF